MATSEGGWDKGTEEWEHSKAPDKQRWQKSDEGNHLLFRVLMKLVMVGIASLVIGVWLQDTAYQAIGQFSLLVSGLSLILVVLSSFAVVMLPKARGRSGR